MKSKKKKFRLSNLLNNNEFVLVLSLLISFGLWINLSLSDSNVSTRPISNIPIQVNLSEDAINNGLQVFSSGDETASVTVSGNRVTIGRLTSDDIIVSAQSASTIMTPGTYPLSLTARNANPANNFEFTSSVSPSVLAVYVDYYQEKTFPIEKMVKYDINSEYYGELVLSTPEIMVSGPQSEISKIEKVAIEGKVKNELKEDFVKDYEIHLYDNLGNEIISNHIVLSDTTVTASFNVSMKKEVPLKPKFKNQPIGIDLNERVTLDISTVTIAGEEDTLNSIDCVYTEEIDFSSLKNKNTNLKLGVDIPENCVILNNIEKVNAKVRLDDFVSKTVEITSITPQKVEEGYNCDVLTESINVTLFGSKTELDNISKSRITCFVDVSNVTGSTSVPAQLSIINNNYCWIYGSYDVNVSVYKE